MLKLTDTEWKIMELVWDKGPLTTMEIYRETESTDGWAKSTVITLLNRMEHKGILRHRQDGNSKKYYPKISRESAELQETRSFLDKFYNGKVGLLISNLVEQEELSAEDLEEIRRIIKEDS
jgi:BlaI family penicillinase repressor